MSDPNEDPIETGPATASSAEDLDEDQLRVDPLEKGMDPPEHWSAADRRGMTQWEQAHPAPLDERLAEEEPDTQPALDGTAERPIVYGAEAEGVQPGDPDAEEGVAAGTSYDEGLGKSADVAGGSVADQIRRPPTPE